MSSQIIKTTRLGLGELGDNRVNFQVRGILHLDLGSHSELGAEALVSGRGHHLVTHTGAVWAPENEHNFVLRTVLGNVTEINHCKSGAFCANERGFELSPDSSCKIFLARFLFLVGVERIHIALRIREGGLNNDVCLGVVDLENKEVLLFGLEDVVCLNRRVVSCDACVHFAVISKEKSREKNFASRVWGKFKASLVGTKGPRFAVIDFRYISEDRPQDKVVFVFWCPDSTGVRDKMMAASTYQSFSAKLGVAAKIQVQDAADLEVDSIVAKLTKA